MPCWENAKETVPWMPIVPMAWLAFNEPTREQARFLDVSGAHLLETLTFATGIIRTTDHWSLFRTVLPLSWEPARATVVSGYVFMLSLNLDSKANQTHQYLIAVDTDNDCQTGLKCYQRGSGLVPGCSGTGFRQFDFCYYAHQGVGYVSRMEIRCIWIM